MEKDELRIKMTGNQDVIPTASFLIVISNMLHILKDVEAAYSEDNRSTLKWTISHISMNSPLEMRMFPNATSGEDYGQPVLSNTIDGLRQIQENGNAIPRYFLPKTLGRAKKVVNVLRDGIASIEVNSPYNDTLKLSVDMRVNIQSLVGASEEFAYTDFGEFEGRLSEMADHGRRIVKIEDNLYGYITCTFPQELTETLKDNLFTERVTIFGETRYTVSGRPLSIRVDQIKRLRAQNELPQFKDLEGMNVSLNSEGLMETYGDLISAD